MPPKKKAAVPVTLSRLRIVALGDEDAFRELVVELLASNDRLTREAALDALVERPLPELRPQLRELYDTLTGDPGKFDPGGHLRIKIAQLILVFEDRRDTDLGLHAAATYETSMGVDSTGNLRALGLQIVAVTEPDLFPYIGVEHVDDASEFSPEPSNTAIQLLAATGNQLSVYQWLLSGWRDPGLIEHALDLLDDVPSMIMSRCIARLTRDALAKEDEPLLTKLAETIVERELEDSYDALGRIIRAPISKELHSYLALLLAGTNRPPLLAILSEHLEHDIRGRPAILDALRVRTTPEQQAIIDAWERDHG